MLQPAIEEEVNVFPLAHDNRCDENGNRLVVLNGYLPGQGIVTGAGTLHVVCHEFATIRLRYCRTKGCGTRRASLIMMFKLTQAAQKIERLLTCYSTHEGKKVRERNHAGRHRTQMLTT